MDNAQWIAEAEQRIEQDKKTIQECYDANCCDYQYWTEIRDANEHIQFLQAGIEILKGTPCITQ
jgi:hypothetical protein